MERRKPLIAVVDDETVFLDLMADILTEEGYRTVVWKEAQGAHAYVRDQQPDLVILDIRLEKPEAGWNILELLRLDPATRNIPVVVCSADVAFLKAKAARLQEKDCFVLEKPFDIADLLAVIEQALPLKALGKGA